MPEQLVPMLATLGDAAADDERWAFEIKWDGVRALACSEPGRLRLESRNRQRHHRALSRARAPQPRAAARTARSSTARSSRSTTEGRPSFGALQRRMHIASRERSAKRLAKESPVAYVVFDLLWLDGHSLMDLPYAERRERLERAGARRRRTGRRPSTSSATARDAAGGDPAAGPRGRRRQAARLRLRARAALDALASRSRTSSARSSSSAAGCRGRGGGRERIGALLVARARRTADLRYAGRVGTGFTDGRARPARRAARRRSCATTSPFDAPARSRPRGAVLRRAALRRRGRVQRVDARTACCAHPSYKGLREDRAARACPRRRAARPRRHGGHRRGPRAQASPTSTRSSIPRRLHEGRRHRLLVRDRARAAAAPRGPAADAQALPQRRRRPVLLREERARRTGPTGCETATVQLNSKTIDFALAQDVPTLVWLGNLADLELHTSLSQAPRRRSARRCSSSTSTRAPPADDRRVLPRRAVAAGDVRGPRARRRSPRRRAPRACRSTCRSTTPDVDVRADTKAVREGGGRAARAAEAPELVVSRMTKTPAAGQGARRLEPERRAQDDGLRLLAARPRAPDGLDAADVGRGPRVRRGRRPGPARLRRRAGARARRAHGDLFGDAVSLVQDLPKL